MNILPITAGETGKMVRPLTLASSPIQLGIKSKTVGEKVVTRGTGRLIGEALAIGLPGGRQVGRVFGRLMVLPGKTAEEGSNMSDIFPFLLTPQTRVKLAKKRWRSRKTRPAKDVSEKAAKELLPITRAIMVPAEELEKTGDQGQVVAPTRGDETMTLLPITQGEPEEKVAEAGGEPEAVNLLPITKLAAGDEQMRRRGGWPGRQMAGYRAARAGETGVKKILPSLPHLGYTYAGTAGGLAAGGGGGALVGLLTSALSRGKIKPRRAAGLGALGGGYAGETVGTWLGLRHFFKKRGLRYNPFTGISGLSDVGAKKYLSARKGGGYVSPKKRQLTAPAAA